MRRLRPRAGWRTPLRARSPGVWIAPAAATTSGARTRSWPRTALPSRSRSTAALDPHPLHPAAGIEPRARRARGREVGQVHRLLRVARAAEGALAAAAAADDVAMDGLAAEPEGAHAPVEDLGVPPDDLPRHGADADHVLHLVEVRRHGRRVGIGDPVLAGPRAEHAHRRAEAGAGIDHRRPA